MLRSRPAASLAFRRLASAAAALLLLPRHRRNGEVSASFENGRSLLLLKIASLISGRDACSLLETSKIAVR